jgi:hypothetical protein
MKKHIKWPVILFFAVLEISIFHALIVVILFLYFGSIWSLIDHCRLLVVFISTGTVIFILYNFYRTFQRKPSPARLFRIRRVPLVHFSTPENIEKMFEDGYRVSGKKGWVHIRSATSDKFGGEGAFFFSGRPSSLEKIKMVGGLGAAIAVNPNHAGDRIFIRIPGNVIVLRGGYIGPAWRVRSACNQEVN